MVDDSSRHDSTQLDADVSFVVGGAALSLERLAAVEDLLRSLAQVTRSGQRHVMNRVLMILRREMSSGPPLDKPDLEPVASAIAELDHEAARIAPVPGTFNRHVGIVTAALARAANRSNRNRGR
jgi:hypothetical protein